MGYNVTSITVFSLSYFTVTFLHDISKVKCDDFLCTILANYHRVRMEIVFVIV